MVLILLRLLLIPIDVEVSAQVKSVDETQRLLEAAVIDVVVGDIVVVGYMRVVVVEQVLIVLDVGHRVLLLVLHVIQMLGAVEHIQTEPVVGLNGRVVEHHDLAIPRRDTQYSAHRLPALTLTTRPTVAALRTWLTSSDFRTTESRV